MKIWKKEGRKIRKKRKEKNEKKRKRKKRKKKKEKRKEKERGKETSILGETREGQTQSIFLEKFFSSLVLFFIILLFTAYGKKAGEDMRKQETKRK